MAIKKIRPKERDSILHSLRAGVTPKVGIQHIQVGRNNEISALISDIDRIIDQGASFRLIIGDYGSGKTFFLSVVRAIALEKNLVVVQADLSPDRRLHSTGGHGRNLYSELMKNLATRSNPDGNAMRSIVEKFIITARKKADAESKDVSDIIHESLSKLSDFVGGYDFAKVIQRYWEGYLAHDEELKSNVIRWLRAEYSTKTDSLRDLGVREIISDHNFYDNLKLFSLFVREAGYSGLFVNLDEMVNLFKLGNVKSRISNYEQILRILNDCLQGNAEGIGFLMGGTPEFLIDPRKGLYSYEALRSRLAENSFAKKAGVVDYSSPSLHLSNLTPEEIYVLLKNLRHVFASGDESMYLVPDQALEDFLRHCSKKIGDAYFRTPRNTIKAFIDMLSVIEQNSDIKWSDLISTIEVNEERPSDMNDVEDVDNDLSDFRL